MYNIIPILKLLIKKLTFNIEFELIIHFLIFFRNYYFLILLHLIIYQVHLLYLY